MYKFFCVFRVLALGLIRVPAGRWSDSLIVVFVAFLASAGVDGVGFVCVIFVVVVVFGVVRGAVVYFLVSVLSVVVIAGAIVILEGTGR